VSNALAIAAVTETFSRIIEQAAQTAVAGAIISNSAPRAPASNDPTVSVYLFHVAESAHFRSADLPTRNPRGTLVTPPRIGLELDYLVSFYGQSEELERERMIGQVASTVHGRPLLSPEAIQTAIDDQIALDPTHFLLGADLSAQVEGVRVCPLDLDLEAMSKLWSVFFQEPHTLSIAYRISIVLIEVEAMQDEGLPVQVRQIRAVPVGAPVILSVAPASLPFSLSGSTLDLIGTGLAAEQVRVLFDGVAAPPQLVTANRVVVPVPVTLAAGIRVLHVAHMVEWGSPNAPDPRPLIESNRVAFALQPIVESSPAAVATPGPLAVDVLPEVQPGQTVRLILRETPASARGAAPQLFEVEQTVDAATGTLSFDLTGTPTGEYWLRVGVDAVLSPLDFDATGFTGPTVVVS
jgi:hypothetical protein